MSDSNNGLSVLHQILDTDPVLDAVLDDPVTNVVRDTGMVTRHLGVPPDPMEALGKGIICGLLHRAFVAGGKFGLYRSPAAHTSAEEAEAEIDKAAIEYIQKERW